MSTSGFTGSQAPVAWAAVSGRRMAPVSAQDRRLWPAAGSRRQMMARNRYRFRHGIVLQMQHGRCLLLQARCRRSKDRRKRLPFGNGTAGNGRRGCEAGPAPFGAGKRCRRLAARFCAAGALTPAGMVPVKGSARRMVPAKAGTASCRALPSGVVIRVVFPSSQCRICRGRMQHLLPGMSYFLVASVASIGNSFASGFWQGRRGSPAGGAKPCLLLEACAAGRLAGGGSGGGGGLPPSLRTAGACRRAFWPGGGAAGRKGAA